MAKFIIEEKIPALVTYRYEVEADSEEDAMDLVEVGFVDPAKEDMYTIYDNVKLEFTRQIVKE